MVRRAPERSYDMTKRGSGQIFRKFGFRVPPETATVLRENDLLCYGWTVSSPESSSRPHCERRTERSACITSKFESCHPATHRSHRCAETMAPGVLKTLAREKTKTTVIARKLKRTERATY
jgi:hypothetical protein